MGMRSSSDAAGSATPLARLPLAWALVVLAPIAVAWPLRELVEARDPALYRAEPMLPFLVITILYYLLIWAGWRRLRRLGIRPAMLGFRRPRANQLAAAGGAALAGILLLYPAARLLAQWLGLDPPRTVGISPARFIDFAGAILLLGLLIPLAEEILFRGYLMSLLRERLGGWAWAGLMGALLFAIPHWPRMGTGGALFILLWSIVPIALFAWTRSLWVSGAAHAINNLFAYLVVPLLLVPDP